MRGMQKCARNLILTMVFGGQTKTGSKSAAGWVGIAVPLGDQEDLTIK